MKLTEDQSGVLLMFAGLSQRVAGAPIHPKALRAWLQEESADGVIDRATVWLFRSGYITTVDGEAYSVTAQGWAVLDQHMIDQEEDARSEDRREGVPSPDEPVLAARSEHPDVLIMMGSFEIMAEAQRMTLRAFPNTAPSFRRKGHPGQ